MNYVSHADQVREHYRKQGAELERERIIALLEEYGLLCGGEDDCFMSGETTCNCHELLGDIENGSALIKGDNK